MSNSQLDQDKMTSFQFEHTWKFDQFKEKLGNKVIESSKFVVTGHDMAFQLKLYTRGKYEAIEEKTSLYFHYYLGSEIASHVKFTFELDHLASDGSFILSYESTSTFTSDNSWFGYRSFVDNSLVVNPKSKVLQKDGSLLIRCKATVSYVKASPYVINQLALLESGHQSDLTLVVCDTKIPVHKTILSAQSPVFKAMFSRKDTKEVQEFKVVIPSVTLEAIMSFLKFIYTGLKPKSSYLDRRLLTVAEKYQVKELKFYCEEHLSELFDEENVVEYFQIAEENNADFLKTKTLEFMTDNFNEVAQTDYWQCMCLHQGQLVLKMTRGIAQILASK